MIEDKIRIFLDKVAEWAEHQPTIIGVALVGSYARDQARPDSDIDLVLLSTHPQDFVDNPGWVEQFGQVKARAIEDWGLVNSLRVH